MISRKAGHQNTDNVQALSQKPRASHVFGDAIESACYSTLFNVGKCAQATDEVHACDIVKAHASPKNYFSDVYMQRNNCSH